MSAADLGVEKAPAPNGPTNGHDSAAGPSASRDATAVTTEGTQLPAAMTTAFDPTRAPESGLQHVPRDARLMALILQSMGIQDVQPPALMMLLEFAHRYLYEVLQDAIVYADHAGTGRTAVGGVSTLSLDDIQLAIQGRVNHSFTAPPNKDMLLSLASSLNSVPLPPISDRYGIKLPPAQHCLTNVNFSIVPNSPPREDELLDEQEAAEAEEREHRAGTQAANGDKTDLADDIDEDEDDEDRLQTEGNLADTSMASAGDARRDTQPEAHEEGQRGTKRPLDEDDDYD